MIRYVTRMIFRFVFKFLYHTEIIGLDNVPKDGGFIICGNHLSNLDAFLIGYRLERNIRWLAKVELFSYKIIVFYMKRFGVVPVDRDKGDSSAIFAALSILQNGEPVGIFPEGTRTLKNKKRIPKVHAGVAMLALKSECPVIPVRIISNFKIFSKIKVIFGEPFFIIDEKIVKSSEIIKTKSETVKLNEILETSDKPYEQISYEKYRDISNEIMGIIYSLG